MACRRLARAFVSGCAAFAAFLSFSVPAQEQPTAQREYLGSAFKTAKATASTAPTLLDRPLRRLTNAADSFRYWNQIAVDASGVDHTPLQPGDKRPTFGEQLGPGRASRAMAIVHIAIFDAVNSIVGGYRSYTGLPRMFTSASVDAAIAMAAHDTLVAMFPAQKPEFDELLARDLKLIQPRDRGTKLRGIAIGKIAAARILARRANDGGIQIDPLMNGQYPAGDGPGEWRQDPISQVPIALGWKWGEVKPFVMRSGSQFRAPPPPAMNSLAYAEAYNEVKAYGGDDVNTPTVRSPEQTQIGLFWAYDGTPSLCAPPRLYNQIAAEVSKRSTSVIRLARLFALVHTAMADAGIAIWESKFHYKVWRPVTGIRESDPGTGPTGSGDGNSQTEGDPTFSPLGAPASNLTGPNFTPPFPAYPSGHAGFGGALFQMLRNVYGTDRVAFTFVSDELNGVTVGNDGKVRPLVPRSFESFSQAEEENGQSRIYLGIHWSYDKSEGIAQGRRVADYVYRNAFQPVNR
jgi:hypothetical protein